ncbi:MAG: hypothetical protein JWQ01_4599 [Massilia sp.]|nr:hypothetical protein [Massilia sp.]
MTDDELHDAILANPAAKAMADAGNDSGAAAAIAAKLPPEIVPNTFLNERSIVAIFPNPGDGEAALQGFEAAAQSNPLFARVVRWLKPEAGGVDFGLASTRASLDILRKANALTPEAVARLKAVAERPATVDPNQVSAAWLRYRPDGKVVTDANG